MPRKTRRPASSGHSPTGNYPNPTFEQTEKEIQEILAQEPLNSASADFQKRLKQLMDKELKKAVQRFRYSRVEETFIRELYFGGSFDKLRTSAVLNHVAEAEKRYSSFFPGLNIPYELVQLNCAPCNVTYDMAEGNSMFSVAIALFILDELSASGKLTDAIQYLPTELDCPAVEALPDGFHDCHYDNELVYALAFLIQQRNSAEKGYNPRQSYVDEAAARRTVRVLSGEPGSPAPELSNRYCLDTILSLISPETIALATGRFREKMWEFFGLVLAGVSVYRERQVKSCGTFLKGCKEIRQIADQRERANRLAESPGAPVVGTMNPIPGFEGMFTRGIDMGDLDQLITIAQRVEPCIDEIHYLENEQAKVRIMSSGAAQGKPNFNMGLEPEILDNILTFRIDNPYEICFAFFWLLDSGSDLPWLVNLGCGVVDAATELLPWVNSENSNMYDLYGEGNMDFPPEFTDSESGAQDRQEDAVESALYRPDYTDAAIWPDPEHAPKELLHRWNLAQLVYTFTDLVLPRSMDEFADFDARLKASGIPDEAVGLLKASLALASDYSWSVENHPVWQLEPEGAKEEADAPEEMEPASDESEDPEQLKKQIRLFKSEIRSLRASLAESEHAAVDAIKERNRAAQEHETDRQELNSLRELFYQMRSGTDEPRAENLPQITFPYSPKHRMVVFGGHETWLKAIQPLLPVVRFVSPDALPNASLIRNADMVWIQSNAISHDRYYKIINITRTHKIPLRYFAYASAEKCAQQLASVDMKK